MQPGTKYLYMCKWQNLYSTIQYIPLRVISDWPFNESMESLLPKFRPVANGAKHKVAFDVTKDVVLCKHSETLVPFYLSYHLEMIRKCKNLKGTRP